MAPLIECNLTSVQHYRHVTDKKPVDVKWITTWASAWTKSLFDIWYKTQSSFVCQMEFSRTEDPTSFRQSNHTQSTKSLLKQQLSVWTGVSNIWETALRSSASLLTVVIVLLQRTLKTSSCRNSPKLSIAKSHHDQPTTRMKSRYKNQLLGISHPLSKDWKDQRR